MHRSRHHPVLGTVVDIRIDAGDGGDELCEAIDAAMIAEMIRLESVFSIFDADSELERWKRGDARPGAELAAVLTLAVGWHERSAGAFNLGARSLHELWRRAELRDELPPPAALRAAAAAIAEPPFSVSPDGSIVSDGEVDGIDLNALAKGWIVDRAVEIGIDVASAAGIESAQLELVVSAGGDLCHRGRQPFEIGIEHPLRPYDNEPPIARAELSNAALATSGGARRGFRVGGSWFSHVIDPRSGEPVDGVASVSVIAADVATADVVATIAALESPTAALIVAERHASSALAVTPDGECLASARWPAISSD